MRHLTTILAAFGMLGCGDTGAGPPRADEPFATASLTFVSGVEQTDTIEAELAPAIVELATAVDATPLTGIAIDFALTDAACGSLSVESTLTDASGRAATVWTLGHVARRCTLEVRVMDASGTPQLSASTEATVMPGAPATVDVGAGRVPVYVGEERSVGSLQVSVTDRRSNEIGADAATWSFEGDVEHVGDTLRPTREAAGWAVATAGAARDSAEIWGLHDLGSLGDVWEHERWERFHDGFVRQPYGLGFHGGCDGDPLDDPYQPDDWVDSLRSVSTFPDAAYSRVQPGLLLGIGEVTLTTWCTSGLELTSSGDVTMMMLDHSPERLGGLVADPLVGSYSRFEGSASSEPYHTVETHVRPVG